MITSDTVIGTLERYVYAEVAKRYPERTALAASRALFECLYLNFRGQYMYVPTRAPSERDQLEQKYESVWHDFNGRNHADLALKYRLSLQQIYAITRIMRQHHRRAIQTSIFPEPDEQPVKRPLTLNVLEEYLPADLARTGLDENDAKQLAEAVAEHLTQQYPGLSFRITDEMRKKRETDGTDDLFD